MVLFWSAANGAPAEAAPCVPSGPGQADYVRCREAVEGRRKAAEALLRDARDMPLKERQSKQREAAQMLLDAWSDGFAAACRAGDAKWCAYSDEILFQAAHAFRWGGDKTRAREVRAMLLDPTNGLADSRMGARALYDSAVDAWSMFDLERAASAFEAFAAKQPKDESAGDALENAFIERVTLGELDAAEKILDALARTYGEKRFSTLDFLASALASELAEREDWPRVERFLASRAALFEKSSPLLSLQVEALRARALAKQGKMAQAVAVYERVAGFPRERLSGEASRGVAAERSADRALEAIAEATLFRAEKDASTYFALTVEKGDKASLAKKEAALARAERSFAGVRQLKPAPPRQAVVAAARVARMYGQLWGQAHLALGASASEPYLARAKAAYQSCADDAASLHVLDADSAACSAWLTRHYANEHHALSELVPAFRANGAERRPPAVLDEDGMPIEPAPSPAGDF